MTHRPLTRILSSLEVRVWLDRGNRSQIRKRKERKTVTASTIGNNNRHPLSLSYFLRFFFFPLRPQFCRADFLSTGRGCQNCSRLRLKFYRFLFTMVCFKYFEFVDIFLLFTIDVDFLASSLLLSSLVIPSFNQPDSQKVVFLTARVIFLLSF